jgi:hypothetical protein
MSKKKFIKYILLYITLFIACPMFLLGKSDGIVGSIAILPTTPTACNYSGTTNVTLSQSGGSNAAGETTSYVLTDLSGEILAIENTSTFTGLTTTDYGSYAVSYDNTGIITGLTIGQNIQNINSSGCLDFSAPYSFRICALTLPTPTACTYNGTTNVTLSQSGGSNAAGETTSYVLTDLSGEILAIENTSTFTGLTTTDYGSYAVSYDNTGIITGLTIGQNIQNVNSSGCLDFSEPYSFRICALTLPTPTACTYSGTTNVTLSQSGGSNAVGETTSYVLTDLSGEILAIENTSTFTGLITTDYGSYAVSYDNTGTITGLTIGQNIQNVNSSGCLDFSEPYSFRICALTLPTPTVCNYSGTTNVTLSQSGGSNAAGETTSYVLTDLSGEILAIENTSTFTGLTTTDYGSYAVSYETASGITGLTIGQNIQNVNSSGCLDFSEPYSFKICPLELPTTPTACTYSGMTNVTLSQSGGSNAAGETTSYVLTDLLGEILAIENTSTFTGLTTTDYGSYAVSYDNTGTIIGLTIGQNIQNINSSGCLDFSAPYSFRICALELPTTPTVCNYSGTTNVTLSQSGGSNAAGETTSYVLTDLSGEILAIENTSTFTGLTTTDYGSYAVSYDNTGTITGLTIGQNIQNVNSLGCLDFSEPYSFRICALTLPTPTACNYSGTTNVNLSQSGGSNAAGETTSYVLTDLLGEILAIKNTSTFTGLTTTDYGSYAVSYDNTGIITGLTIGQNIQNVNSSGCLDFSEPYSFRICALTLPTPTACTYSGTTNVTLSQSGGSNAVGETTSYVLTDLSGEILAIENTSTFTGLITNIDYGSYAVSYETASGITGLTIGQNIQNVNSSGCLDFSEPYSFKICPLTLPTPTACTYSGTTNVTLSQSGGSNAAGETTSYVLTDLLGEILAIENTSTFTGLTTTDYGSYAVSYDNTGTITGLTIGQNIQNVNSLGCLDFSAPYSFRICALELPTTPTVCNYSGTTNVTLSQSGGSNAAGETTSYVLTDSSGEILAIENTSTFTGLTTTDYGSYAVSYDNTGTITGLTIGQNIQNVNSLGCLDFSEPYSFRICALSCNYTDVTAVTLTEIGGSNAAGETTRYVLTNLAGQILDIQTNPTFNNLTDTTYQAHAISYETANGVIGLTVGQNILNITSSGCFNISNSYNFRICNNSIDPENCTNGIDDDGDGLIDCEDTDCNCPPPITRVPPVIPPFFPPGCDYESNQTITFMAMGGTNASDETVQYILTDGNGEILQINNSTMFNGVVAGNYMAYAASYPTASPPNNLNVGQNIMNIVASCIDYSAPYIFTICDNIIPGMCDYTLSESINLITNGGSSGGTMTTEKYFVTNEQGLILGTSTSSSFLGLPNAGNYFAYVLTYESSATLNNGNVNDNINNTSVTNACFDWSLPHVFQVCNNVENCANAVDDDGDGLVDCDDPNCQVAAPVGIIFD